MRPRFWLFTNTSPFPVTSILLLFSSTRCRICLTIQRFSAISYALLPTAHGHASIFPTDESRLNGHNDDPVSLPVLASSVTTSDKRTAGSQQVTSRPQRADLLVDYAKLAVGPVHVAQHSGYQHSLLEWPSGH